MHKKTHCGRVATLVVLSLSVLTGVHGADVAATNAEGGDIQALKQELAEQKRLLEELRLVVLDQKKQFDGIRQQQPAPPVQADPRALIASAAPMVPPEPAPKPVPLVPPPAPQGAASEPPSPLQIKIGDATITPVGFMDITNIWRSTNAGSGLQTNFGSFPYNNTVQGRLSAALFERIADEVTAETGAFGWIRRARLRAC